MLIQVLPHGGGGRGDGRAGYPRRKARGALGAGPRPSRRRHHHAYGTGDPGIRPSAGAASMSDAHSCLTSGQTTTLLQDRYTTICISSTISEGHDERFAHGGVFIHHRHRGALG